MSDQDQVSRARDVQVNVESMPVMHAIQEGVAQELGINPEWQQIDLMHLSADQNRQIGEKRVTKVASEAYNSKNDHHVTKPLIV